MPEPVVIPVVAILAGALLIAGGIFSHTWFSFGFGMLASIAGVATVLVGMIMLFTLAKENNEQEKGR